MAGKLYKYNDSWVSYGYLHDTFGYTDAPSFDISYKSTNPWGGMDTTGYMSSTDFYDIRTYELWKQGLVGWYSMNEMAVQGSYPDTATETMMRNGNITSNAAYITDPNGVDYYIVQAAISEGWLTLDEWALLGWEPYTVTQIPLCGSMGADYSESMTAPIAERMERGGIGFTGVLRENFIPESGVVEAPVGLTAYFTSQGASATSDKTMTFGSYQLYDSSGAVIYSDNNHTYTFLKAFDYAGNEVAVPSSVYAPVFNNSGSLCLAMHPGSFTAYRLTYTVSDNT